MSLTYPDISFLTFCDKIKVLKKELAESEQISRDDILTSCINDRLHELLLRYHEETDRNSKYLLMKASAKVLKELTRINRLEDKDVIAQYMIDDEEE